jgi:hypothetical protein
MQALNAELPVALSPFPYGHPRDAPFAWQPWCSFHRRHRPELFGLVARERVALSVNWRYSGVHEHHPLKAPEEALGDQQAWI